MKIRIINENDWEKVYEFDKSIIRVGNQLSCDVQLRDNTVQPLLMQIVRRGEQEVRYQMRFFADNIIVTRGDQSFTAGQLTPYDVLDGDKISFSSYRLIISLEDEKTRVRTSPHMRAEMFLSRRELSMESAINGVMALQNLGTEKPCQFRMQIRGIPMECLQSAPLPYLYPGGSSSVGFIISHMQTKPSPGFHTVSITISAPDEYFGETLEFNQDIYVNPVFENEFILEDDSPSLTGFNAGEEPEQEKNENVPKIPPAQLIIDTRRMNAEEEAETDVQPKTESVRVVGKNDSNKDPFKDQEDSDEKSQPYSRRKRKEKVVVIRGGSENAFEGETSDAEPKTGGETDKKAEADEKQPEQATRSESEPVVSAVTEPENKQELPQSEEQTVQPENERPSEPAAQPVTEPVEEPGIQPVIEQVKEPETQPVTKPLKKSKKQQKNAASRVIRSGANPFDEPETEPVTEQLKEPETQPVTKPVKKSEKQQKNAASRVIRSGANPFDEPETEPVTEQLKEPETQPVTEQPKEPEIQPGTEQFDEPETQPEEYSSLEMLPDTEDEPEPENHPLSEQAEKPAVQQDDTVQTEDSSANEPDTGSDDLQNFEEYAVAEAEENGILPEQDSAKEEQTPLQSEPPAAVHAAEPEPTEPEQPNTVSHLPFPIPVITHAGSFDDEPEEESVPVEPVPEEKPTIRVMKGDTFDE